MRIKYFRFIGEPYSGPLFPTNDKRNPFEVLVPKLIAAAETFDMIPVREKAHFEPQPWNPATDSKLPGTYARGGYFLQADTGSRFVVGGTVVRPLATRRETDSNPSTSAATAGETVFVPAGTPFRLVAATRYARAYVFANGGGLGEVLCRVGREYEAPGVPEESVAWGEAGKNKKQQQQQQPSESRSDKHPKQREAHVCI
ncbi:hypothetical protein BUE80_DR013557 [Diplocarpon rosae]|nr:hypothetical protein BUE80_DR013557 [Diplocarpon rosae]